MTWCWPPESAFHVGGHEVVEVVPEFLFLTVAVLGCIKIFLIRG